MTAKLLHGKDESGSEDRAAIQRAERNAALLDALCNVLETTDRIMSGNKSLKVRVMPTHNRCPAWTDGESVFLNERQIHELFLESGDMEKAVRVVKGTNYHELAHVLFSPREGMPFHTLLKEWTGYDYTKLLVWNMIEDQRIETLYTRSFAATQYYFVAAAMQWLLRDLQGIEVAFAYPLLRGRRYLSKEVRGKARNAFTKYFSNQIASGLDEMIDTYVSTSLVSDPELSMHCIDRIHSLLLRSALPPGAGVPLHRVFDSATSCRISLDKGEVDQLAEEDALRELRRDIDLDGGGRGGVTFGVGVSDGGGGGDASSLLSDALLDAAREALEEALRSHQIALDVNRTQAALQAEIDRLRDLSEEGTGPAGAHHKPVPIRLVTSSNRLAEKLRLIHDDLEPALVHDLPAGKLNIARAIRHVVQPGTFDIFDRYEPGTEEEAEIEVAILLDLSTSMRPQIRDAAAAMWVLKRALDCTGVRSTVYGFGSKPYVLYAPRERVKAREMLAFPANDGDTRPFEALRLAYRTLRTSECPNKMLVVITDGRWGRPGSEPLESCDNLIASMREAGTNTLLFTLGGALRHGGHNCEHVYEISSPEQVVDVVEETIASALAGAVA